VLPGPLIGAAQLAELSTTFGPVAEHRLYFFRPNEVPACAQQFGSVDYPLSGRRASGLLSFRIADQQRAGRASALLATAAVWKAMVRDGIVERAAWLWTAQVFDTHPCGRCWWLRVPARWSLSRRAVRGIAEAGGTEKIARGD